MKKQHSFIALLLCLVVCLVFSGNSVTFAGTRMPAFSLESVQDGKIIDSSRFAGKVLLITFFATWCPPCKEEVPVLNELQTTFEAEGFSVVGLSVDQQGPKIVADFIKRFHVNYPILMAESKTTRDFGGVYGIPVAFLVNKSGNVVKKYPGYVSHKILEKDVRSLLN